MEETIHLRDICRLPGGPGGCQECGRLCERPSVCCSRAEPERGEESADRSAWQTRGLLPSAPLTHARPLRRHPVLPAPSKFLRGSPLVRTLYSRVNPCPSLQCRHGARRCAVQRRLAASVMYHAPARRPDGSFVRSLCCWFPSIYASSSPLGPHFPAGTGAGTS